MKPKKRLWTTGIIRWKPTPKDYGPKINSPEWISLGMEK